MALDDAVALLQELPSLLAALPGSQAESELLDQQVHELSSTSLRLLRETQSIVRATQADRRRLTM